MSELKLREVGAPLASRAPGGENLEERLGDAPHGLAFLAAWRRWRGELLVPTRADIRPEELGATLLAVTVFHAEAPDRVTIRLAAANYEALTETSAKGLNYIELAAPADRPTRIERLQNLLKTPCGAIVRGRVVLPSGLAVTARNLLLPVAAGPAGPIDYIYSAADFEPHRVFQTDGRRDPAPLADEFSYVDIGAGLPR